MSDEARIATCRCDQLSAICVGAFADKDFPIPEYTVWVDRKHDWVAVSDEVIEYRD